MTEAQAIELLRQGIAAARASDKPLARAHLEEVLRFDSTCEIAWLWYAGVAEFPHESVEALEQVLQLNPQNEHALQGIKQARLNAAIHEVRAGNKEAGRTLLLQCCGEDPGNELSWLWLAGVTENPEEAIDYLNRVLDLNPQNERARSGLEYYRSLVEPPRTPWQCAICQHQAMNKQHTCPACGCILTLVDVDTILTNGGVDEEVVRDGIRRLLGRARVKPDFTIHCYIALAYLNLNQLNEGVNQFQAALRLQEHEPLRQQLEALEHRRAAMARSPRHQTVPKSGKPRRLLIVDDSATIRKVISILAERNGFEILEAGDGAEALERIQDEGIPDLVVMESQMQGMDGFSLCKSLRRNQSTRNLPIIILADQDGLMSKIRGRMAGATFYLPKPFHPDTLLRAMQHYCPVRESSLTPAVGS